MHDRDQSLAIYRWVEELRQSRGQTEFIEELKNRLDAEANLKNRRTITFLIATELRSLTRYKESEGYYLDLSNQFPNDPIPLIGLAEQKLHYEDKPDEALAVSRQAVDVAFQSGNFRRQALGVQARIAQRLNDYALVEHVLRSILGLEIAPGQMDVATERDFFDSLPAGVIEDSLAQQYDRFSRERKE